MSLIYSVTFQHAEIEKEVKERTHELEDAMHDLQTAKSDLQQAYESKNLFTSFLMHELRFARMRDVERAKVAQTGFICFAMKIIFPFVFRLSSFWFSSFDCLACFSLFSNPLHVVLQSSELLCDRLDLTDELIHDFHCAIKSSAEAMVSGLTMTTMMIGQPAGANWKSRRKRNGTRASGGG